jgi:hypothetical protein
MSVEPDDPGARPRGQRLNRLLRWYPRGWRERYGEEFLADLCAATMTLRRARRRARWQRVAVARDR